VAGRKHLKVLKIIFKPRALFNVKKKALTKTLH